ncbi:MAG: hypothetical protein WD557_00370 [Dehalococcoidia bacterium]
MSADPIPPPVSRPRTRAELKRARARQRSFLAIFREWQADDSGEQERNWETLKRGMNETRKALGQLPVRQG